MVHVKLAVVWATALIATAVASRFGIAGEALAEGLFYGLLVGAGASLAQVRCGSC